MNRFAEFCFACPIPPESRREEGAVGTLDGIVEGEKDDS